MFYRLAGMAADVAINTARTVGEAVAPVLNDVSESESDNDDDIKSFNSADSDLKSGDIERRNIDKTKKANEPKYSKKREIQELRELNEHLKEELSFSEERFHEINKKLQNIIMDKEREIQKLNENISNILSPSDTEKEILLENELLKSVVNEQNREMLQEENSEMASEMKMLKDLLSRRDFEIQNLHEENSQIIHESATAQEELSKRIVELSTLLSEKERNIQNSLMHELSKGEFDTNQSELLKSESRNCDLSQKIQEISLENEMLRRKLDAEHSGSFTESSPAIQQSLKDANERIEMLNSRLISAMEEVTILQQAKNDACDKAEILECELIATINEIETLKLQFLAASSKADSSSSKLLSLTDELKISHRAEKDAVDKAEILNSKLISALEKLKYSNQSDNESIQQVDILNSKLILAQNELEKSHQAENNASEKAEILNSNLIAASKELEKSRQAEKKAHEKADKLEADMVSLRDALNAVENIELSVDIQSNTSNNEFEVAKLQGELKGKRALLSALTDSYHGGENDKLERQSLANQVRRLVSELQYKEECLDQLQMQLQQLTANCTCNAMLNHNNVIALDNEQPVIQENGAYVIEYPIRDLSGLAPNEANDEINDSLTEADTEFNEELAREFAEELEKQHGHILQLQHELNASEAESRRLCIALQEANIRSNQLQETILSQESHLSNLKESVAAFEDEIVPLLKLKLEDKENELEHMRAVCDNFRVTCDDLSIDCSNLRKDFNYLGNELFCAFGKFRQSEDISGFQDPAKGKKSTDDSAIELDHAVQLISCVADMLKKLSNSQDYAEAQLRTALKEIGTPDEEDTGLEQLSTQIYKVIVGLAAKSKNQGENKGKEMLELQNQILDLKNQETSLKEEIIRLKETTNAEILNRDKASANMKQVVEQMRRSLNQATLETKNAHEERDILSQKLRILASENDQIRMNLDEVQTHVLHNEVDGEKWEEMNRQFTQLEEKLQAAQHSIEVENSISAQLQREIDSLRQVNHNLSTQLMVCEAELNVATADCEEAKMKEQNLIIAIEEIQAEAAAEARQHAESTKKAADILSRSLEAREASVRAVMEGKVQVVREDMQSALDAAQRALLVKEGEMGVLQKEINRLKQALEGARMSLANGQNESLDRAFVANLVVQYVTGRHDRRVLELMSRILGFSDNELIAVGLASNRNSGSIRGLLKALVGSESDSNSKHTDIQGESLGDAWLNFLMTESESESTWNNDSSSLTRESPNISIEIASTKPPNRS